jgi:hypothetical protein
MRNLGYKQHTKSFLQRSYARPSYFKLLEQLDALQGMLQLLQGIQ